MFTKAERHQTHLKLCISGPSGSGKTFSSLLVAKGLSPDAKIAVVDTEAKSSALYSDVASFDIAELKPPFSVDRYIECINEAEKLNYEVLIVDSLSHVWIGEGGLLDMHSKVTKSTGNSFSAWNEVTPHYNKLIEKIHQSKLHLICCLRAKSQYVVEDSNSGKKVPRKIGMEPEFRPNGLYEFDIVFALNDTVASVEKDRSQLFTMSYFTPSIQTGIELRNWLNGDEGNGNSNQQQAQEEPEQEVEEASSSATGKATLIDLFNTLRELGLSDRLGAYESYLFQKYGRGTKDLGQEQIQEQYNNLCRCKKDRELFQKFINYLNGLAKAA